MWVYTYKHKEHARAYTYIYAHKGAYTYTYAQLAPLTHVYNSTRFINICNVAQDTYDIDKD